VSGDACGDALKPINTLAGDANAYREATLKANSQRLISVVGH